MSLKPNTLDPVADYPIALKPTLGYEQQLYVSVSPSLEPGIFQLTAANSGVYTPNNADTAALAVTPLELLAELETDVNCGVANLVLTVVGTDQNDAALTGTATFAVPAYAQETSRVFPKGWAVEITPNVAGKLFKTITAAALSVVNTVTAVGAKIAIFGMPALTTFRKIGCKTQLNYDPKVPVPHAIQCGRDMSAFIKPGEIPEGSLEITAKIPTFSDGLARINGIRVTGLIKEIKEDKVTTMHVFLMGLIMTSKPSIGESVEPGTLAATSKYEDVAFILAQ